MLSSLKIRILLLTLILSTGLLSHAQSQDTLKPVYLEGTDIKITRLNLGFNKEETDSIFNIDGKYYKIYLQSGALMGIRIRKYYVLYTEYTPVNSKGEFLNKEHLNRSEYFDIDGSFIFRHDFIGYLEESFGEDIFINFEKKSILGFDGRNLNFYNNFGIKYDSISNVEFAKQYLNDNGTHIFYKRRIQNKLVNGVATYKGDILWEKEYPFKHSYFIEISDHGHLLLEANEILYSYDPDGKLLWEKPRFKTFHPYNSDGTLLVTSDRTPRLIDNKTGEFIPTRIREELNSLGNPQLSHQRKFIPDSDLFAVLAYYKTHEEILIFNTNGKCIAKKKIDKKYITEDSSILRYRKNENIISVLQNGQVIDKIILNE